MKLHLFATTHACVLAFFAVGAALFTGAPRAAAAEGVRQRAAAARPPVAKRSDVEQASFETPMGGGDTSRAPRGGVPLPPRGQARGSASESARLSRPAGAASTVLTGVASLAVVLGLFFVVAWALRRGMPRGAMLLPADVVEVLGRAPLSGRQFAHLVRCGNKMLLVYLAPGCAETLTEITDPVEVDRLAGLCKQSQPQSTTASFRQVFQQFSREKPDVEGTRSTTRKERHPLTTAFDSEEVDA
ncbi:MAG TPA: flagellar biosynthetic protein FliO [Pirellulales bacterium]|nr:flagellar biosynthetic protein FliO [Pirellulales bacterium]